jgi:hypothetical protein
MECHLLDPCTASEQRVEKRGSRGKRRARQTPWEAAGRERRLGVVDAAAGSEAKRERARV